jgi:hypothetical protein
VSITATFLGLLLYATIGAIVAALFFRVWRLGKLPVFVVAAFSTVATLAIAYATTGKMEALNLLGVSLLFGIAWFSANAVQLVTMKLRGELDA